MEEEDKELFREIEALPFRRFASFCMRSSVPLDRYPLPVTTCYRATGLPGYREGLRGGDAAQRVA